MMLVLAAEGLEADAVRQRLARARSLASPFPAHSGVLEGHEIVLVETGVGKVAAAAALGWAVMRFAPEAVFFGGVAGALSPGLKSGDLVVARDAVQWDVNLTAFGRAPGELGSGERYLPTDPELTRAVMASAPGAVLGRIASGDRFVDDPALARWIQETFQADAVEMEGAAAVWTARQLGVPLALFRVVSDRADDGAQEDFEAFLRRGAGRLADVVEATLGNL